MTQVTAAKCLLDVWQLHVSPNLDPLKFRDQSLKAVQWSGPSNLVQSLKSFSCHFSSGYMAASASIIISVPLVDDHKGREVWEL